MFRLILLTMRLYHANVSWCRLRRQFTQRQVCQHVARWRRCPVQDNRVVIVIGAQVNYAPANNSGTMAIVSSIEFDRDGTHFILAGVTKKIKVGIQSDPKFTRQFEKPFASN